MSRGLHGQPKYCTPPLLPFVPFTTTHFSLPHLETVWSGSAEHDLFEYCKYARFVAAQKHWLAIKMFHGSIIGKVLHVCFWSIGLVSWSSLESKNFRADLSLCSSSLWTLESELSVEGRQIASISICWLINEIQNEIGVETHLLSFLEVRRRGGMVCIQADRMFRFWVQGV